MTWDEMTCRLSHDNFAQTLPWMIGGCTEKNTKAYNIESVKERGEGRCL